jgi:DNA replication protein DnaC
MHPTDELIVTLKKLRLSGILYSLDIRLSQAATENLAPSEFLLRVLTDEVERRDAKQIDGRLRKANFENQRAIEDFDFSFNPKVPKTKIMNLSTCAFIDKHENVCLVGETGVGKSHIAQAIGHRACLIGHQVVYISAQDLFAGLRAGRADNSHGRRMAKFLAADLLIIDDLGLRKLSDDEPLDLYEIIRGRYERASTLFTSNRALDEWTPLFNDPLLASAAMDRLRHHAHIIELTGASYRDPLGKKRRPVE